MAATLTTDQFLDVLRKSDLVDEKRLQSFLQSSSTTLPNASRDLAQQLIRQGLLTPFQAGQLLGGKWRGFHLASRKYKLLERLGAGGMGTVFLCEHVRMKRLVALKVLPTDRLKDDQSALERFDREARASAALDHPNIVRAHDLDTDGKLHFLVMEFVDGSSLQDVVKKHGPLEIDRACHYIEQAALGLQHAHEAGWVHRDVKPGNLLVDRTGMVKILDMGLARLFTDDSDNLTKKYEKNAVLGTADYLAPEQATNSSDVDIRADIYSLGATFYYLLTGRGPFDEGTVTQKLIWHQTKPPDSLRSQRPEIPKELEAVINKMMAKKPVHRYQEPAAVAEALRPWTQGRIEPPAEEEMPRLCPAIANYTTVGSSAPLSALSGPPSTIRSRARSGPRSTSLSHKRLPSIAPAEWPSWLKWAAVGIGGFAILGLGIAIAYWFTRPDKPMANAGDTRKTSPTTSVTSPEREKPKQPPSTAAGEIPPAVAGHWYVARGAQTAGRSDVFPTLAEALAKATSNQVIRVLIPDIEEQVTVSAKQSGVSIESGLSGRVLWKAPVNAVVDQPLLRLESAGAVRVSGFEFDGGRRVNTLIHVSGPSAGLRLEESYLTDAAQQSLVLAGVASGPGDQAIAIDRVRFTTLRDYSVAANHKAAAVRPAAVDCTGPSPGPLHLNIRWCRFEGLYKSAIAIGCSVEADLRHNRFYSLKNEERPPEASAINAIGVQVPDTGLVRLSIASNTMSRVTNLLRLDKLPPTDRASRFTLRSNLALNSTGDAWVSVAGRVDEPVAKALFDGSAGNVSRPGMKGLSAAVVPQTERTIGYIDVNLTTDGFLRYKKTGDTAQLLKAGADGEPVGVPPVD